MKKRTAVKPLYLVCHLCILICISVIISCEDNKVVAGLQKQMPIEFIKKVLIIKIQDKVDDFDKKNQGLLKEIESKQSYIDSLKFELLNKFNQHQDLMKQQQRVIQLKQTEELLETNCTELKQKSEKSIETISSLEKEEEDRQELLSISEDGLREIELVKQNVKRVFLSELRQLKKFNVDLVKTLTHRKHESDKELTQLNKGLDYLRNKLDRLTANIKDMEFENDSDRANWIEKTKKLKKQCEDATIPDEDKLNQLEISPISSDK